MPEVLLFHHAHGLTAGVQDFAEKLRRSGHVVHAPDLYEGRVFDALDEGVAYAHEVGFAEIMDRGRLAADGLSQSLVYAGFSLGVLPAQMLAQSRAGAKGALLFEACIPPSEFGGAWPGAVPVQIHGMDADEFFAQEGDLDAARDLIQMAADGELFLYPGEQHLFADNSLASYDEAAATLMTQRVVSFLDGVT